MNSSYALEHNCALLEQSKTLETLFRLTCGHGDADAALFLENGEEKRWSYRQYEAMTRQYAACLSRAFPGEGYIALSVDTCKEWFPLFWGVILSGVTLIAVFGPGKWRPLHFTLYFLIGWSGLMFLPDFYRNARTLLWFILAGGLVYTLGMIPFARNRKWNHCVWHVLVLAAAAIHWLGIYGLIY